MTARRRARVHRLSMTAPDDVSAIEAAIADGRIDPTGLRAVLAKTEGNGCVNDFSRGLALQALRTALAEHPTPVEIADICTVMSGGTEGALAPHWLVFSEDVAAADAATPALALGRDVTPPLDAADLGRMPQVDAAAEAVRRAMADADIATTADVHFVQIKCPLLTAERAARARAAVATLDTLASMGLSRGASALGVGVALGELDRRSLADEVIGRDTRLFSGRASCSAGIESSGLDVLVIGMSRSWAGPLAIGHAVMDDAIDVAAVRALLRELGCAGDGPLDAARPAQVAAVLAKAEASKSGRLRGHRHTMLDDSDIAASRHARAFVGGALAAQFGHGELYVSGGAEHQGPDGGGPCAVIVARSPVSAPAPARPARRDRAVLSAPTRRARAVAMDMSAPR